jgi:hypothetical protein
MAAVVVVAATAVVTEVATVAMAAAVAVASVADPHPFTNRKSPHLRALFCLF